MFGRGLAENVAQLRRDLAMLGLRFAGKHAPPLVDRKRGAFVPSTLAAPRTLVVARVVAEARDVVTLVLTDPEPGARAFDFLPGQFFTVQASIDGETVPRNYSASNAPGTSELHLTIKRNAGGRVSGTLVDARAGDRLRVLGPFGSFTVTPSPDARRSLLLVAGGVGITPLLSIARAVLATERDSRVGLVYGNRTRADVAFADAIAALATEHGERFVVRHVLETPEDGFACEAGRLDRATFERTASAMGLASPVHYVCGPDGMQDEVLAAIGDAPVRTERFTTARKREGATGGAPRAVTIRASGKEHRAVAFAGATLLEAGLAAGAPMPSSCSVGGCGACRVKVVSGDVEVEEPNCLTDEERRRGYVLACVGRPKGACTVVIE